MDFQTKINQLKTIIENELNSLIDSDYVLLGVPYYENIGDILIWEGTETYLKNRPHKCLRRASIETFEFPNLPSNVIILLQGGGNFGDIWSKHQEFRLNIIKKYPNNKIIILPQTIYYANNEQLKEECKLFKLHSQLYICARDKKSFLLLKDNKINNVLLLPDMAFCILTKSLSKLKLPIQKKLLVLRRKDKESAKMSIDKYIIFKNLPKEECDWPSYEKSPLCLKLLYKLMGIQKITHIHIADLYAYYFFRPILIRMGVNFLSQYQYIYTTRLHVAILSILLEKPFSFFDNSYGKNSTFYETWLSDLSDVKFIKP